MNPIPVVLYGDVVRLEPLASEHADQLLDAGDDPEIWRYMPIPQPRTVDEVRAWIDQAWRQASTGDQLPFAILDAESDRVLGSTSYLEIRRSWRTLEIGRTWLSPSAQRTAADTESKLLLLKHAFDDLGALRVQFKTDGRNLRSQQSLEQIGAVKEGVLRKQRINHDGFVRDAVYYSILDDEWPAVRAKLEEKLKS